jgi:hypothetical protein
VKESAWDSPRTAIDKKHTPAEQVMAPALGSGNGTMWLKFQCVAQEELLPWEVGENETFCHCIEYFVTIEAYVGTIRFRAPTTFGSGAHQNAVWKASSSGAGCQGKQGSGDTPHHLRRSGHPGE